MMDYNTLYALASKAGHEAALPSKGESVILTDGTNEYAMSDYPCGFAWVVIKGNTAFARWAKSMGLTRPAYPKGLQIRIGEYGQSMTKKEAHARAMAKVLRDAGIDARAESRMD